MKTNVVYQKKIKGLGIMRWINQRLPVVDLWQQQITSYLVPKNLNIWYVFGALALVILVNQGLTGVWLTMFYIPTPAMAFDSIEYIMRDVNYGWLLRYLHSTGASAFFIVLYCHIYRSLRYGSYQKPRELVWLFGMVLLLLSMAEAFCGYLLPWGQMSYWGAQVLTSLASAIPYVGDTLVVWLRGDYQVSGVTLQRFYTLHIIIIPLTLLLLTGLHLISLHYVGGNNPEGIDINLNLDNDKKPVDGVAFHPYHTAKILLAVVVFLIIFLSIVFFYPEMAGYFLDAENFNPANPEMTPEHITPVWYLAAFYTLLRIIPNKLGGALLIVMAIILLCLIPFLDYSPVRSMRYKGWWSKITFFSFIISFIVLGYLGKIPITPVRQYLATAAAIIYFAYFLLMPLYTRFEKYTLPPLSLK